MVVSPQLRNALKYVCVWNINEKKKGEKNYIIPVIQALRNVFQNLSSLSGISLGIIQVHKKHGTGLVRVIPTMCAHNFEQWPSEKGKGKEKFFRCYRALTYLQLKRGICVSIYNSCSLIADGQNCCIPNLSLEPNFVI